MSKPSKELRLAESKQFLGFSSEIHKGKTGVIIHVRIVQRCCQQKIAIGSATDAFLEFQLCQILLVRVLLLTLNANHSNRSRICLTKFQDASHHFWTSVLSGHVPFSKHLYHRGSLLWVASLHDVVIFSSLTNQWAHAFPPISSC